MGHNECIDCSAYVVNDHKGTEWHQYLNYLNTKVHKAHKASNTEDQKILMQLAGENRSTLCN
jgi:hypothetical protein